MRLLKIILIMAVFILSTWSFLSAQEHINKGTTYEKYQHYMNVYKTKYNKKHPDRESRNNTEITSNKVTPASTEPYKLVQTIGAIDTTANDYLEIEWGSIFVDYDKNVYVIHGQYPSNSTKKFDSSGNYVATLNFKYTYQTADGYLWKYNSGATEKYDSSGTVVASFPGVSGRPDMNGYFYTIATYDDLTKYDSDGNVVGTWDLDPAGEDEMSWYSFNVDSNENVYFTTWQDNAIYKIDSAGNITTFANTGYLWYPDIFVDINDNVYVMNRPCDDEGICGEVFVYDSAGNLLESWGTSGYKLGEFFWSMALAVDTSAFVYIPDIYHDRVQIFQSDGTFVRHIGQNYYGEEYFKQANDVALDSSGNIYVTDIGTARVDKFNSAGVFQSSWGIDVLFPTGIHIDGSDVIYVQKHQSEDYEYEPGDGEIAKYNLTGVLQGTIGGNDATDTLRWGRDVATDSSGNVYSADSDRILKFNAAGNKVGELAISTGGIAINSNDVLYVTNRTTNDLVKLDTDLNILDSINIGTHAPVAIDSQDNVFVGQADGYVSKYDSNLNYLTKWTVPNPRGMAIDASDKVYVVSYDNGYAVKVYQQAEATLTVNITPAEAVAAGAQWSIDGGQNWYDSGHTLNGYIVGDYTLSYKDVAGWVAPADAALAVNQDAVVTKTGTYTVAPTTGELQVNIYPAEAVTAGTQWSINGGSTYYNSGVTLQNLSPGTKTVTFNDVAGWQKPEAQFANVIAGNKTTISALYEEYVAPASLAVIITPVTATYYGRWSLDQVTWYKSGAVLTNLSPGNHTIYFNQIEKHISPAAKPVTLASGEVQTVTASYVYDANANTSPIIHDFSASKYIVGKDDSVTLSWRVEGADAVVIDHNVGPVQDQGTTQVTPGNTTTYKLSATNIHGTSTGYVKVMVTDKPYIHWFTSSANASTPIYPGGTATLRWGVQGAANVYVKADGTSGKGTEVAETTGQMQVQPEKTTGYTLTAVNAVGQTVATTKVHISVAPQITKFTAVPMSVVEGNEVQFIWQLLGAEYARITDIGYVNKSSGKKLYAPDESGKFTLTASNSTGSSSKDVFVTVVPSDLAPDLNLSLGAAPAARQKSVVGVEKFFDVIVENAGGGKARDILVTLESTMGIGSSTVINNLAPGASKTVTLSYIPTSRGKGKITITVDPLGFNADINDKNNDLKIGEKIDRIQGVDLLISKLEIRKAPAEEGNFGIIDFEIMNVGNLASEEYQWQIWTSKKKRGKKTLLATKEIISLEPGEVFAGSELVDLAKMKRIFITLVADAYNTILEVNEENNSDKIKVKIKKLK